MTLRFVGKLTHLIVILHIVFYFLVCTRFSVNTSAAFKNTLTRRPAKSPSMLNPDYCHCIDCINKLNYLKLIYEGLVRLERQLEANDLLIYSISWSSTILAHNLILAMFREVALLVEAPKSF